MSAARIAALILAFAIMLGLPGEAAPSEPAGLSGRGLEARLEDVASALAALPASASGSPRTLLRIPVTLRADRAEADALAGALSGAVALAADRAAVIVSVTEAAPVDVREGAQVDAWAEAVAALVDRCAGRVMAWEIGGGAHRSPEEQGFFIKRTALAVKGVDRRALVLGADPRARPLADPPDLAEAVGAFLDGHVAEPGAVMAPGLVLTVGRSAGSSAEAWAALVDSFERGEAAAIVAIPPDVLGSQSGSIAGAFRTAFEAFPEDAAPTGNRPPATFPGEARIEATELVVASDLSTRLPYRTRLEGRLPAAAMRVIFDEEPAGLLVHDPMSGAAAPVRHAKEGGRHVAEVPLASRPLVLSWQRARGADDVQERVAVASTVDPTVEEILARHFAAQAARDRKLVSFSADLATDMRYELGASGQAFEVRIEGTYYFHENGIQEIENERYFINGARYKPKEGKAPEIPLLQPETVQVLPLEVRLDRSYEYRLLGRADRGGRPAWKVAFKPLVEDATAFTGVVWIDAETFDRLAVDLSQTRLAPPVLVNEQKDEFGPVLASDGEHHLVRESHVHRTVSLLGGTVGVEMRMRFSNHRVNDAGFEAARAAALASSNQMLRQTDGGLKYLRTSETGERVEAESSSRKIFVVAGARYDDSYDGVIPLAGVNWLDHDLGGRGLQFNMFAAGAINTFSIADPSLFGSRVTLGVDAFVPFVKRRDRENVPGSGVDDEEIVRSRSPRVDLEISRPVGRHGRAAITLGVAHESWSKDDDTADDFVVPADTWVASLGGKAEIHRKGWDARFWVTRSERQDWEAWGRDTGSGPPPLQGDQGYWKWGTSVARSWHLGKMQSVGFDAHWVGGSGLDRFSQHEFAAFGGRRLPGFDGSGIHFDEAALLKLSWGADVAGVFGAQVEVGVGRTWNRQMPDAVEDEFGPDSDHVGIAFVGTVPGPWSTVIRFDVGAALHSSDHDDAEGNIVAQAVVLKLLGR